MTYEEIMQLEAGEEMYTLIAREVMGFEFIDAPRGYRPYWKGIHNGILVELEVDAYFPSHEIFDAWHVIEKMRSDGHEVYISTTYGGWDCTIAHDNGEPEENHRVTMLGTAHEDTVPLAICRAALLAVLHLAGRVAR